MPPTGSESWGTNRWYSFRHDHGDTWVLSRRSFDACVASHPVIYRDLIPGQIRDTDRELVEQSGLALERARLLVRRQPLEFSQREVELVTTFAGHSAIALDHARLFQEGEARNRDLTETLEQHGDSKLHTAQTRRPMAARILCELLVT